MPQINWGSVSRRGAMRLAASFAAAWTLKSSKIAALTASASDDNKAISVRPPKISVKRMKRS